MATPVSKANTSTATEGDRVRSEHAPIIRDGLCRHIRCKGMLVNIGERPDSASSQRNYLAVDPHALPWDGTVWWCGHTSKTVGPDDRPCDNDTCVSGRRCFAAEDLTA
jgi:hypothetical protein